MSDVHETNTAQFEDGPITPERIGAAVALVDIGVFALIGHFMFEDPALGALAGLFVGGGIFLFLPLFMWAEPNGGLENMAPESGGGPFRSFHRLAAGMALPPAGIVLFVTQFVELDPFFGLAIALLAGAGLYVPLAWLLPNAQLE
ncbi:hypothetical protein C483_13243 [Natrialba hulunbeirensis JCM 10989]|uniref:Uncharacterized protein n=1 Tax=Natrialba hulunbeirensis JCM 10989 TaxID=1227493 RepID=L9ZST0_9EURY|nr:hypothetical protein [Natrialba hulunbeirensis]ELY89495.1 hypothetical protein C483_13243 [Natrialba hulunbeirensis JCM 10989]